MQLVDKKHKATIQTISNFPIIPWGLLLLIPFVGYILSFNNFETAFPRSGALMVLFAVTTVYLNHFVIKADGSINEIHTMLKNPEFAKDGLTKIYFNGDLTNIKSKEELQATSVTEINILKKVQERLVAIEFLAGAAGTFIWGFGDLFVITSV